MRYLAPPTSDLVDMKFKEEWFEPSLVEKYNGYMNTESDIHVKDIISLLNCTIKRVNIVGFSDNVVTQEQGGGASQITMPQLGSKSWVQALSTKTVQIQLQQTDSYMTWLFLWESIQLQYTAKHSNTIHSVDIDILNTKRQKAFTFTFDGFVFTTLDDLPLDAETQNNDFGQFEIGLTFGIGKARVKFPTLKNPH